MRIGIAQINATLGDFSGNRRKILEFVQRAKAENCDLVVFPELSLMGYLPNDLLERSSVVDEQLKEFARLQKELPKGIAALVGLITKSGLKKGKSYYNTAALIEKGKKARLFHKELLPTYDVFDEARHLEKGSVKNGFVTFKGKKLLVTICEDIWGWDLPGHPTNYLENPLVNFKGKKVDLVINMSASPFTLEKERDRQAVVTRTARFFRAPMIYTNMVGGQDEIIFDGGSFVVNQKGQKVLQSEYFAEDLRVFDTENVKSLRSIPRLKDIEKIRRALVLGIRDFVRKIGMSKALLGLSGGIDSAVVACLAVEALGKENVTVVTLPGPFNAPESKTSAEELAKNLGVRILNLPISAAYEVVLDTLHKEFGQFEFGLVNENLQARLRGLFLMAVSNKENALLLTTGNKSEYAAGYTTLYGDMCGGLAPIADLLKGQVYALAENYNSERELIPEIIISRPPSAELRPNQRDQDSLPPYDELDASVRNIVERQKPARTSVDKWLLSSLAKSEFKRWQAPPILKVSRHAFGRGRRMPIAHRAKS